LQADGDDIACLFESFKDKGAIERLKEMVVNGAWRFKVIIRPRTARLQPHAGMRAARV
jgi:hypothetical protein